MNTPPEKKRSYRSTETQYKGTAKEMAVTYDIEQKTRGGGTAIYPKVKRVYIAGDVKDWKVGEYKKRSGREVHGVIVEYEQSRKAYRRQGYSAKRGATAYQVPPAAARASSQLFKKVIEVPEAARNIRFHKNASRLPARYQTALQTVR